MSSTAQPALPQPLSVWSPNRSNRHRNHTISAAIQMKNQKDQRRTSPKSFVMASMAYLSVRRVRDARDAWSLTAIGAGPPHPRRGGPRPPGPDLASAHGAGTQPLLQPGDDMDLFEIDETRRLTREDAAARLHALADALARNNAVEFERDGRRITVRVPDEVNLKIEVEIGDENELEIELTW